MWSLGYKFLKLQYDTQADLISSVFPSPCSSAKQINSKVLPWSVLDSRLQFSGVVEPAGRSELAIPRSQVGTAIRLSRSFRIFIYVHLASRMCIEAGSSCWNGHRKCWGNRQNPLMCSKRNINLVKENHCSLLTQIKAPLIVPTWTHNILDQQKQLKQPS